MVVEIVKSNYLIQYKNIINDDFNYVLYYNRVTHFT